LSSPNPTIVRANSGLPPEVRREAGPHILALTLRERVMRVSNSGEWQLRQCLSPSCSAAMLRVRRDTRSRELWWVGRLDLSGTWRIAAAEPCCPECGSDLEAGVVARNLAG